MSRHALNRKRAHSPVNAAAQHHVFDLNSLLPPAADAPVDSFVDRVSSDSRRIYRDSVPVVATSPVKRARLHASVAQNLPSTSSHTTPLPASALGDLAEERYSMGFDDGSWSINQDEETLFEPVPMARTIKPAVCFEI